MVIRNRSQWVVVLVLGIFVIVGAILTYLFVAPSSPFTGLQNDLSRIEPDATVAYRDLEGNEVELSSFKGKPLIVNSWATWMPFSKDELARMSEVKKMYGDEIVVLAINRMEDVAVVTSYLDIYSLSRDITILTDPDDSFYTAIGGYAMPETVFYHSDGTIAAHTRGPITRDELFGNAESILK